MLATSQVVEGTVSALPPGEIDQICRVGADVCVLITVSSKREAERLARRIHDVRNSPRNRFVPIDCRLPRLALDQQLFGRLERPMVSRCTLFLKEVGRLTTEQQRRLLRVLRQEAVAHWPSPPPARVVASTSEGLYERVVEGSFDANLFYRLNTIHLLLSRQQRDG